MTKSGKVLIATVAPSSSFYCHIPYPPSTLPPQKFRPHSGPSSRRDRRLSDPASSVFHRAGFTWPGIDLKRFLLAIGDVKPDPPAAPELVVTADLQGGARILQSRAMSDEKGHLRPRRSDPLRRLTDEQLLDMKLCELPLDLNRSPVRSCLRQLDSELQAHGLRVRPHFWFAEEWFSPDGIPGVAIPFYVAHPRLLRLERRMMRDVEGGTRSSCMKILRHEAGHAVDHAYRLSRRVSWKRVFGDSARPYPSYYQPKPYSRHYVLHLDHWYAQSHPDEDFAETFAVWLAPRAGWRRRYADWPALRKLEYVDALMQEIAGRRPINNSRARIEPLATVRKTLGEYYEQKRSQYASEYPDSYDIDLGRLFGGRRAQGRGLSAAAFIERSRPWLRRHVACWTGGCEYTLDQVLKELMARCRELKLTACGPPHQLRQDLAILLGVQTMRYLHSPNHRVGM
jgi:hypothetical protein